MHPPSECRVSPAEPGSPQPKRPPCRDSEWLCPARIPGGMPAVSPQGQGGSVAVAALRCSDGRAGAVRTGESDARGWQPDHPQPGLARQGFAVSSSRPLQAALPMARSGRPPARRWLEHWEPPPLPFGSSAGQARPLRAAAPAATPRPRSATRDDEWLGLARAPDGLQSTRRIESTLTKGYALRPPNRFRGPRAPTVPAARTRIARLRASRPAPNPSPTSPKLPRPCRWWTK